jgi:glutathione synthase
MKLGIIVTDVAAMQEYETNIMLAYEAVNRGHQVWLMGIGDLAAVGRQSLRALAVTSAITSPSRSYPTRAAYHGALLAGVADRAWIDLAELDVLLLRSDAYEYEDTDPSLQMALIRFGFLASGLGVVVLSDPVGLARAIDKTYVEQLPDAIRPRGLVTRTPEAIKAFLEQLGGPAVVKPVEGACGRNTFLLRPDDGRNINQIIAAATRHGYVVVQEYVPEAIEGTTRMFFLDGLPLQVDGHYAALTQRPSSGDFRSNSSAGGTVAPAVVDDQTLRAAAQIGRILAADGLFLVGVDIAGGKVLDVGATTPGGMRGAERFEGVRFVPAVLAAIEARVPADRPRSDRPPAEHRRPPVSSEP